MPQFSDSLQPYLVNAQVSPSRSLCLLSVLTNNPGPPRAGGEECKNIFLVFISIGGVEEVSLKAQPLLSALLTCCWNSGEGGRHLCHCLSSPWLPFYPSTFSPFIILPHAFMMAHLLTRLTPSSPREDSYSHFCISPFIILPVGSNPASRPDEPAFPFLHRHPCQILISLPPVRHRSCAFSVSRSHAHRAFKSRLFADAISGSWRVKTFCLPLQKWS